MYIWNIGDGNDIIQNQDGAADTNDIVNLGFSLNDIDLLPVGNDLIIQLQGGSQGITIKNWNLDVQNQVDVIQFTDGNINKETINQFISW